MPALFFGPFVQNLQKRTRKFGGKSANYRTWCFFTHQSQCRIQVSAFNFLPLRRSWLLQEIWWKARWIKYDINPILIISLKAREVMCFFLQCFSFLIIIFSNACTFNSSLELLFSYIILVSTCSGFTGICWMLWKYAISISSQMCSCCLTRLIFMSRILHEDGW